MQRKDITVGLEVAVASKYDWDHHRVIRARVLDVTVEKGEWYNSPKRTIVHLVGVDSGRPFQTSTANVRGPWDPIGIAAEARQEAARDQAAKQAQVRDTRRQRAEAAMQRAQAAGCRSAYHDRGRVSIEAADLLALLDRLERAEAGVQELIGEREHEGGE